LTNTTANPCKPFSDKHNSGFTSVGFAVSLKKNVSQIQKLLVFL